MNKLLSVSSLAVGLALVQGCMVENTYTQRYDAERFERTDFADPLVSDGNLELLSARLRGQVGDVRNIDHEASVLTGYGDESYASVEVHADTPSGIAMNLVDIWGGLDALEPGTSRTFTARDEIDYDSLNVQVLNCAGEDRYDWTYDQPADEVTVTVSEGETPDVVRVDYTARTLDIDPFTGVLTGGSSEVSGTFDVVR